MEIDMIIYLTELIIVSFYGLVSYKYLTNPFKALAITVVCIALSEIIARVLLYTIRNTDPPYHVLCVVQYIGMAYVYAGFLNGQKAKRYIMASIIPFVFISLINSLFFQTFFSFPSNAIMLSYLMFVIFSLILFMHMLNAPKEVNIFSQGIFWFNCAMLIYSILLPVCFGILNYLIKHNLNTSILNDGIQYVSYVFYAALGYAMYLDRNRSLAPALTNG